LGSEVTGFKNGATKWLDAGTAHQFGLCHGRDVRGWVGRKYGERTGISDELESAIRRAEVDDLI
jgi:hypothetical protein